MASDKASLDPRKFPDEVFELYSIPAFDAGAPESVLGAAIGSAKQLVRPGDVLLSRIVPHIRRAWAVPQNASPRAIGSGEWIVFRSDRFDPSYLRHVLVSDRFHRSFMQTVAGVGGSLLRARPAQVADIEIPLPPIEEQRRIAAVLDQADEVREKRRASLALLDSLTESIFLDMFGRYDELLRAWPTLSLADCSAAVHDCPHSTPAWTDSGVVCLRTSNLGVGSWSWADTRYVSEETYALRSRRGELAEGDIILSREGTVGIAAIVPAGTRMCMGQRLVQVRANPDWATPRFFLQYLLMVLAPARIGRTMVGSTAQHLNVSELKSLQIPLPPMDLQVRYATVVDEVVANEHRGKRSAGELDSLFSSLQQRAFAGAL